jgi:SAM-dependent methyltransferase
VTTSARTLAYALRRRAPRLERALRTLYALRGEVADRRGGGRDPLSPPRRLRIVGRGDFEAVGQAVADAFVEKARIGPDASVLDVGCGVGRVARVLATYLEPGGRYVGFDIVAEAIEWCRRAYGTCYPNFEFRLADVANARYSPRSDGRAVDYRFPAEDGAFDGVLVSSVFTHMRAAEVASYLREINRVLRPGGRCVITCFLLDEKARAAIADGRTEYRFQHALEGGAWALDPALPEAAIAYEPDALRTACERAGLVIADPAELGSWTGTRAARQFQDTLVAAKPEANGAAP